ncbi:MAG: hypothetical protein HOE62_17185 [Alphaproteobacteria bacterium]|nr:hypothetical protein [Alphaproteobacteria bacterium]MBT4019691.1 hypothetical protein [Alphaproteobacteria bacterium]
MTSFDLKKLLAAVLGYVGKILLFMIVPGLHLISVGKKPLGYTLVFLFFAVRILPLFVPFGPLRLNFMLSANLLLINLLVLLIAYAFLVLDLPKIGARRVTPICGAALALFLLLTAFSNSSPYDYAVTRTDHMCPLLCYGDIAVYKINNGRQDDFFKPNVGDLVVYRLGRDKVINRIVGIPGQTVCQSSPATNQIGSKDEPVCADEIALASEHYFVSADNRAPTKMGTYFQKKIIRKGQMIGILPKVVANWPDWVTPLSYLR